MNPDHPDNPLHRARGQIPTVASVPFFESNSQPNVSTNSGYPRSYNVPYHSAQTPVTPTNGGIPRSHGFTSRSHFQIPRSDSFPNFGLDQLTSSNIWATPRNAYNSIQNAFVNMGTAMRETRAANGSQSRGSVQHNPNVASDLNFSSFTQVPLSFSNDALYSQAGGMHAPTPSSRVRWADSLHHNNDGSVAGLHHGGDHDPPVSTEDDTPSSRSSSPKNAVPPRDPPPHVPRSDMPPAREPSPTPNPSPHVNASPPAPSPPQNQTISSEIAQLSTLIQSLIVTLQNMPQTQGAAIPSLQNFASMGLGYSHVPPVTPSSHNSGGMGVPGTVPVPPYSTTQIPPQPLHSSFSHSQQLNYDVSMDLLRSFIPAAVPTLPSTSSIPLLQGRSNFAQWHEAAVGMVQNLGLNSWICGPAPPNLTVFNPDIIPVYPPDLSVTSSVADCQLWQVFWARDGIAAQILTSRLTQSVAAMLPPSTDPVTYRRRTARDILTVLRTRYGINDFASAALLKEKLWSKQASPSRIVEYVTEWRTDLNQLHAASYQIHWGEAIMRFLAMLPNDIVWQSIRNTALIETSVNPETLDRGSWDYFAEFVLQTDANNAIRERARYSASVGQFISNNRSRPNGSRGGDTSTSTSASRQNTASSNPQRDRQNTTSQRNDRNQNANHTAPSTSSQSQPRPQVHLAHESEADIEQIDDNKDPDVNSEIIESIEEEFQAYSSTPPETPPGWLYTLASQSPLVLSAFIRDYQGILDSGSSKHLFTDRRIFWNFNPKAILSIGTANCGKLETKGKGMVKMKVTDVRYPDKSFVLNLEDAHYAPECPVNLFSFGTFLEAGMRMYYEGVEGRIYMKKPSPRAFGVKVMHRLLFVKCEFLLPPVDEIESISDTSYLSHPIPEEDFIFAAPMFEKRQHDFELGHDRLIHAGKGVVKQVLSGKCGPGFENFSSAPQAGEVCDSCVEGKLPQQPYYTSETRATKPLELIHTDTCGPMPVMSPHGHQYFQVLYDDYTCTNAVVFLRDRTQVPQAIQTVITRWELLMNANTINVRCDGSAEQAEGELLEWYKGKGIQVQVTAPYAHPQNGSAERFVRVLEDDMNVLLAWANLPLAFWEDAIRTSSYVRFRLPCTALPRYKTPYEIVHRKQPNYSMLRAWGCRCWVAIPSELLQKGSPRRYEAIFVGYEEGRVGWRVRDLRGKYRFSRDVIFDENTPGYLGRVPDDYYAPVGPDMPNTSSSANIPQEPPILDDNIPIIDPDPDEALPSRPKPTRVADSSEYRARPRRTREQTAKGREWQEGIRKRDEWREQLRKRRLEFHAGGDVQNEGVAAMVLLANVDEHVEGEGVVDINATRESAVIREELNYVEYPDGMDGLALAASHPRVVDISKKPENYREAHSRPDSAKWKEAELEEMASLNRLKVFKEAELPKGAHAVGVRWVYDFKYNELGEVVKHKARLVAQGFSQRPGEYGDTYAPVARLTSIRIIIAYAVKHDLELFVFDFKTAFLNAPLSQTVYCKQIPGYPLSRKELVYILLKALYGLKQASAEWYKLLWDILRRRLKFLRCPADNAVFYCTWTSSPDPSVAMPSSGEPLMMIIALHVDDGLCATNSNDLYQWVIRTLSEEFVLNDLGPAKLYLGITIIRDRVRRRAYLTQRPYIQEILSTYNLSNAAKTQVPLRCKISDLPTPPSSSLPDAPADLDQLRTLYMRIIGSLLYLAMCTRPDIAYAVMALSQYNTRATRTHLLAAKGVLRYLAGTPDYMLEYGGDRGGEMSFSSLPVDDVAFTDADWASDISDRRSISGYAFFLYGGLVSWSASKQKAVALSSTEAEYMALTHCLREALWIQSFTTLLSLPIPAPFPILSDNQGSVFMSTSPSTSGNSKHIDIKFHFIRDHTTAKKISVAWVPTSDMVADIFTKPLGPPLHYKHCASLGLVSCPGLMEKSAGGTSTN